MWKIRKEKSQSFWSTAPRYEPFTPKWYVIAFFNIFCCRLLKQVRAFYLNLAFFHPQVPAAVAHSEFWQRYFYKVFQLEQVNKLYLLVYSKLVNSLGISQHMVFGFTCWPMWVTEDSYWWRIITMSGLSFNYCICINGGYEKDSTLSFFFIFICYYEL